MKARHKAPLLTATRKLGHNIFFMAARFRYWKEAIFKSVLCFFRSQRPNITSSLRYSTRLLFDGLLSTFKFFAVLIPVSIKDRLRSVDHGLRRTGYKTRTRYKTRTTDFVYKNSCRNVKLRETEIGLP